ncbi:MAG: hypothetical protein NW202_13015 [Nitrospira sp.]|nr:hypothetical protein [Nitrospira sp.]
MASWVNSLGLVFDIIGAVLLWRYGLPEAVSRTGAIALILEQDDKAEAAKTKRYDLLSSCGMILLVVGFVLQLLSNFL